MRKCATLLSRLTLHQIASQRAANCARVPDARQGRVRPAKAVESPGRMAKCEIGGKHTRAPHLAPSSVLHSFGFVPTWPRSCSHDARPARLWHTCSTPTHKLAPSSVTPWGTRFLQPFTMPPSKHLD